MPPKPPRSQIEVPGEVPARGEKLGSGSSEGGAGFDSRGRDLGTRARRTRSPHPGVVLIAPQDGHPTWRARCEDPDTGQRVKVRLDPLGAGRNAQTRREWAIQKAQSIAKRKDALAAGAPRATGTALATAVDRYFKDHPRLRERTRETYAKAAAKLKDWCAAQGVRSADQVTAAHLEAFRTSLAKAPRQRQAAGASRGKRKGTSEPRAASAVNVDLRSTKVLLGYLRRVGLLPKISRDDVTDRLRMFPTAHDAPAFLRPAQIRDLLNAAHAHDAETFKATRLEHAGQGEPGATRRYPPIAPLVLGALLSGMRFGELAGLDWSEVDLDAGEIRLTSRTKTKRARSISLEVSPTLASVLTSLAGEKPPRSGSVWGLTEEQIRAAAKRLSKYGAPPGWTWQGLRRTCGTYLTNAPGIFGAASAYRSARQLGHSVTIAERHYLGVVKVPKEATTLEAAMGGGREFNALSASANAPG